MAPPIQPAALNTLDWAVIVLFGVSSLRGLTRGLVRTLFSFFGLFGGLVLATWFYAPLASILQPTISSPKAADTAAFLLISLGTPLICSILGGIARGVVTAVGLGFPDRLLGGIVGGFRGTMLAMAVVVPLAVFLPGIEWIRGSALAPYLLREAHAVSFIVPEDFRRRLVLGRLRMLQMTPSILNQL